MDFLRKKRASFPLLTIFLLLLCASCTTVIEKTGRLISRGGYKGGIQIDVAKGELRYSRAFYRGFIEFTADYDEDAGIVKIKAGFVKNEDSILRSDDALRVLRNRRARIEALAGWMRSSSYYKTFNAEKDFDAYWRALILPETVKKKNRPASYARAALVSPETQYAERFKWNLAYTASLFPASDDASENAELSKLRNSGATLRDFNEALPWLYFETQR